MIARPYNAPLHTIALLTAVATFPLIFMGGLVTSHGAGMSVPDWPNSYGYNMFLFPPRLWIGGIIYEHTHRLMASLVGFLSIILTVVAWRTEPRLWVRWLATAVLGTVIFQGVLGGLRVVLVQLDLAIVHACLAQAFFCLAALVCIVTSRWWADAPDLSAASPNHPQARGLMLLATACVVAVYCQLIVGAVMRHEHAGLAIPDLPLAYGKLLPPTNAAELQAANAQLSRMVYQAGLNGPQSDLSLPTQVTFFQLWIHFAHRVGALIVSGIVLTTALLVVGKYRQHRKLLWPAGYLLFLIAAQLALGVLTVLLRKPADLASLHVATGALLLVTCFILSIRAARLYSPLFRHEQPAFPAIGRSPEGPFSEQAVPAGAGN